MTAALRGEQRALLRLVLAHDYDYAEIAKFLGASTKHVQARAREAVAAMGADGLDPELRVADYLLGQADVIERADVVNSLRTDPDVNLQVQDLVLKLRLLAPSAALPALPRCMDEPRLGHRDTDTEARTARPLSHRVEIEGRGQALIAAGAVLVVILMASQILLPSLLEAKLRGRLEQAGATVEEVDLGAVPAVKALWGDIDSLAVSLGRADTEKLFGNEAFRPSEGGVEQTQMLERLSASEQVKIAIDSLGIGDASLREVAIEKSDDTVGARFAIDPDELRDALPLGAGIEAEASARGGRLRLALRGGPLKGSPQRVEVYAEGGRVVGAPKLDPRTSREFGLPEGAAPPAQPIFANDHLSIDSLSASSDQGRLLLDVEGTLGEGGADGLLADVASADAAGAAPAGSTTPPPAPAVSPPGGAAGALRSLPPGLAECMAEQGVEVPSPGQPPPAGLDSSALQRAAQACAGSLPPGATPAG